MLIQSLWECFQAIWYHIKSIHLDCSILGLPWRQETWVQSLDQEDPWMEEMATHSSGKNPMNPGKIGKHRKRKIPMNIGTWWSKVCGVTKSQTQLIVHIPGLKYDLYHLLANECR